MKVIMITECDKCGRKVVLERNEKIYTQINMAFEDEKLLFRHAVGGSHIWLCSSCQADWEALQKQQEETRARFYSKA